MRGNRTRGVVPVVVGVLLSASIALGFVVVSVSATPKGDGTFAQLPPRTGVWPVNFTFYGDASLGWGFSNATIREPGPSITVYLGDIVNLTLIGHDGAPHTWFIDYDNNSQPSPGEPASPTFNTPPGKVVKWNSPPLLLAGNYTYRCAFHPTSMTGAIRILPTPRPVNITLYGNAGRGWGFSNATIKEPGPPLVVFSGTNLTIRLVSNDSEMHNWFIDYNNDSIPSLGEPLSRPDFGGSTGKVVVWSFVADQTGDWTYRCGHHPNTMTGRISIIGGPPPELHRGTIPLITSIMLGALAFVLVFAAVYHARAVRAAKRMR